MSQPKIDLPLLLEEMDRNHWTSNATEYVERAVRSYDDLLSACREALEWVLATEVREQLSKAIKKAEANNG